MTYINVGEMCLILMNVPNEQCSMVFVSSDDSNFRRPAKSHGISVSLQKSDLTSRSPEMIPNLTEFGEFE